MSATEARVHFGELMDGVERGETVIVERGGEPRAAVVPLADYVRMRDQRRADANRALAAMDQHRARLRADRATGRFADIDVSELLHDAREERDEQILDSLRRRQPRRPLRHR